MPMFPLGSVLVPTAGLPLHVFEPRYRALVKDCLAAALADATFVPPPPDEVPAALGALETFLHRQDELPLLVKIGLAHAQFETIHPFLDGNGRVGRLLITFLLCERGVLHKPVLYLSHYFKRHRQIYYERLQAVREEGDFESWLAFFLRGVAQVSEEAADTARRILEVRELHRRAITDQLGRAAGNGHRVLERLYGTTADLSVKDVQALLGTTFAGANQIVQRLADLEIVAESGLGRRGIGASGMTRMCDCSIRGRARNRQSQNKSLRGELCAFVQAVTRAAPQAPAPAVPATVGIGFGYSRAVAGSGFSPSARS